MGGAAALRGTANSASASTDSSVLISATAIAATATAIVATATAIAATATAAVAAAIFATNEPARARARRLAADHAAALAIAGGMAWHLRTRSQ